MEGFLQIRMQKKFQLLCTSYSNNLLTGLQRKRSKNHQNSAGLWFMNKENNRVRSNLFVATYISIDFSGQGVGFLGNGEPPCLCPLTMQTNPAYVYSSVMVLCNSCMHQTFGAQSNHKNAHNCVLMMKCNYVVCSVTMHVCVYAWSAVLLHIKKVKSQEEVLQVYQAKLCCDQ